MNSVFISKIIERIKLNTKNTIIHYYINIKYYAKKKVFHKVVIFALNTKIYSNVNFFVGIIHIYRIII